MGAFTILLILVCYKRFRIHIFKYMVCKLLRNKPSQVSLVGVVGTSKTMVLTRMSAEELQKMGEDLKQLKASK